MNNNDVGDSSRTTYAYSDAAVGQPARIVELDGLRGIAILLVMLHHFMVIDPQQLWERWVVFSTHFGWSGVDLFFVLSGFLITGILLDARHSPHYFRSFYARRVLRIFPLYYAVLIVALVLLPIVPHPKIDVVAGAGGRDIFYWTFLSNWSMALDDAFHNRILAPTWSLAIEEQFYLIWPLVVLACGCKRLLWLCPLLAMSSLALRLTMLHYFDAGNTAVYVLTPCRFDSLALGAWSASLVRHTHLSNGWLRALPWIAALAILAAYFGELCYALGQTGDAYSRSTFALGPGISLLAVGFTCLVLYFSVPSSSSRLRSWLRHPALLSFGKYSYAIYLTHMPIRAALRDVALGPDSPGTSPIITFSQLGESPWLGQICFLLLATCVCWLVGWLSWRLLEQHFLRLKQFFPY